MIKNWGEGTFHGMEWVHWARNEKDDPGRDWMLILQNLARFFQKDVNLAKSCKILARLSEFQTAKK